VRPDARAAADVWRHAQGIVQRIGDDPTFFTLLANLTTLKDRCRFAPGEDGALAARYLDLPFAAVSFYGAKIGVRQALQELLSADEPCYALVGEAQLDVLRGAVRVLGVEPEWQMIYRGRPDELDAGDAVRLGQRDWDAMCVLAREGGAFAFEANALEKGPCHGVWRDGRLVSMAGTHLELERLVEIGNVVTHPAYRRRGLAAMAVSATVRCLCARGKLVFLQVFKSNGAARALYEQLGFCAERTMYLARFVL